MAVDLFFLLSGVLITWILLGEIDATGTIDVRRFYLRRVLRLARAYVSMLVAVLLGAAIFEPRAISQVPAILRSLLTIPITINLRRTAVALMWSWLSGHYVSKNSSIWCG